MATGRTTDHHLIADIQSTETVAISDGCFQPEAALPITTQTLMLAISLGLDLRAVPPQHSTPR